MSSLFVSRRPSIGFFDSLKVDTVPPKYEAPFESTASAVVSTANTQSKTPATVRFMFVLLCLKWSPHLTVDIHGGSRRRSISAANYAQEVRRNRKLRQSR